MNEKPNLLYVPIIPLWYLQDTKALISTEAKDIKFSQIKTCQTHFSMSRPIHIIFWITF